MTTRCSPLALAILAALSTAQICAASEGQQLAQGVALNLSGGDYETDGEGMLGHGFFARLGGSIISTGPTRVVTHGPLADALHASGASSFIEARDITLINEGDHGSGARAVNGARITLVNASIHTTGTWSHGVHAEADGVLQLTGSSILVDGLAGRGLFVEERGGTIGFSGGTITTLQTESRGLEVRGIDSLIAVANSEITTYGMHGDGALLGRNGRLQMDNVRVRTYGEAAYGINLNGVGAVAVFDRVNIRTTGLQGKGVWALRGGELSMSNSTIDTDGGQALGIDNRGSRITLLNTAVRTLGENSHALYASQEYETEALYDGRHVELSTAGFGAFGAFARRGAEIRLDQSSVHTTGAQASALLSSGVGSRIAVSASNIRSEGELAHAVDVRGGGNMAISASQLSASGEFAAAVHADGGTLAAPNLIDISDSLLESAQMPAVDIQGGASQLHLSGSELRGANGVAILAVDMLDDAGAISNPLSVARIDAINTLIDGDIINDSSGRLEVALASGSLWRGSGRGLHLGLDGSQWQLNAGSTVESLALGNGQIIWEAPVAGMGFATLAVNGDYSSNGGVLALNAAMGGDESVHDLLHVRGDTSGQTGVVVKNLGGHGGLTDQGMRIIQVDGRSQGQFDLIGRAVAGNYEYFLHKGTRQRADDGHWYLRSDMGTTPDPCAADPDLPECVVPPEQCELDPSLPECQPPPRPEPVLRPEPGAYLANQVAAVQMFQQRRHDRSGTANGRGVWVRSARRQADYGVVGGQLDVSGDTSLLQIGTDLASLAGERLQIGVMAGHGTANNTVTSRLTGYSAKGKVEGTAIGAYASWLQHPGQQRGGYVDSWLQYGHYRNSVHGDALARERYRSDMIATSLEAGYALRIVDTASTQLAIEPQVQLSHRRYSAQWHAESNGTVIDRAQADGLSSRVGVRLFGSANSVQGNRVQPFIGVHWLRESSANRLRVDAESASGGMPRQRVEARGGAELRLGQRWSAWGDMGLQWGGQGYREVSGQIGVRGNW